MVEMYGYAGRVAIVDLSSGAVTLQPTCEYPVDAYLGGRGLAHALLDAHMPVGADPLGPDNVLVFAPGALVGTNAPAAGRWAVAARSPLTGLIGSGNAGGFFGVSLKWAGFDALVVKGQAAMPSYLHVRDGEIRIEPADKLWGLDTREVVPAIRAAHGDPGLRVAAIGPAGEKLAPIANILGEERAAGRGGVGAVMGSKKLKAVAAHGTMGVRAADANKLNSLVVDLVDQLRHQSFFANYRKYGSSGAVKNRYGPLGGMMPYNGQQGVYPYLDEVNGHVMVDRGHVVRSHACAGCPVGCLKVFGVTEGPYAPTWGEGPQTATFICFGARCVMTDVAAVLKAHAIVNTYGLDMISTDGIIAFAFECFEKGIITTKDTGGLELNWGDDGAVLKLIELMGRREGFGELLSLGVRELARRWGPEAERAALHVKGMEMTPVDPRGFPAWALMFAVASRGADHMRAYVLTEFGEFPDETVARLAGTPKAVERFAVEGKGRLVALFEEARALVDCLGVCKFVARGTVYGFPEHMTGLVEAVLGRRMTSEDLRQVGERVMNAERLFNLRHGLTAADDRLPARFLEERLSEGPAAGRVVDLEPMLAEYYAARGWDRATGHPSAEKLSALGLAGS